MSADPVRFPDRLPVTVTPVAGEAMDGYLERLAAANAMPHPELIRRLRAGEARTAFLAIGPDGLLVENLARLSTVPEPDLESLMLAVLPGIDTGGLDPARKATWCTVAARGWPPELGTALCPACLRDDGIWQIAWRHPWTTACVRHGSWLLGTCPSCRRRFRSHRTPLRPVDAPRGTCGNPAGVRGRNCPQPLADLHAEPATSPVLHTQTRIDAAISGKRASVLGQTLSPDAYLAELKALTVLLLHLAVQPAAETLVTWVPGARADHARSAAGRGARWGLAPPADLQLRGQAIATADAILREPAHDAAADALYPWTEVTPRTNEGQLGWLADHTTMTPTLTRLVMAATAHRRRLSTLLAERTPIEPHLVPQTLALDLYAHHLGGTLAVTDTTGRLFASLCLAKLGRPGCTWTGAARLLDLPGPLGTDMARACTGDLRCSARDFLDAINTTADRLVANAVDYRAREATVRALSRRRRWYDSWSRRHLPGSPATSRRYAITWLWAIYAGGHPAASPGWHHAPTSRELGYYRRYARRINGPAGAALLAQVNGTDGTDGSGENPAHAAASAASARRTA